MLMTRRSILTAGALMAMQTVKAVEVGAGAAVASTPGSSAHDTFALAGDAVVRGSNRAGSAAAGRIEPRQTCVRDSGIT